MLERLNDGMRSQILALKWLGYLLQHTNHEGLKHLLHYYRNIGWIGEAAEKKLISMAEGLKSTGTGEWRLPVRVHLTSLLFIKSLMNESEEDECEIIGLNAYIEQWIQKPDEAISV